LYMWEYSTDPTINMWGLINKSLDEDMVMDYGKATPNTGPLPTRKQKHM